MSAHGHAWPCQEFSLSKMNQLIIRAILMANTIRKWAAFLFWCLIEAAGVSQIWHSDNIRARNSKLFKFNPLNGRKEL